MQHDNPISAIDPWRRQRDGGYLLLAILLMMALMIIAATVEAPRIVQQMKRDREQEMIHRGTEYARAVKKFYKKFGSYPTSLDQLDNTNQLRFLRKRYKDPLTKDGKWTLLHYGDIQMAVNPNAPGTPAAALASQGQGGTLGAAAPNSTPGGTQSASGTGSDGSGGIVTTPAPGPQVANSLGSDSSGGGFAGGSTGAAPGGAQPSNGAGISPFANSPNGQTGAPGSSSSIFGQNSAGGNQTFGGGAIVGVASLSKDPTIRIYNKKKKYNEWQFIYDPTTDQTNVLLRGPYQPIIIGGAQVGTPAGQMNGQQSPFGQQQSPLGQQPASTGQPTGPGQSGTGSQYPSNQNQPQQ